MISHKKPWGKSAPKSGSLARAESHQIAAPEAEGGHSSEARAGICATLARGQGVNSRSEGRGCKSQGNPGDKVTGTPSPVTTTSPSLNGGYQYGCTIELHPNREIRISKQAQRVRARSGGDTQVDREYQRYSEACYQLELIEKWLQAGGYWDTDRKGKFYFHRYTSYQRDLDRKGLLDIIKLFQEARFSQEGDTTVALTSPKFAPPPPPPLPPEQLNLFKYAAGEHPLPSPDPALNGLELKIPVRKVRKPVGFCRLDTVNKARRFGLPQRRAILRTGAMMSKMYPEKGQAWEVTLTLPGSTKEAKKCLASYTSWLINRLLQLLRDISKSRQVDIDCFYVWEWQKRGALHLHMAIGCKRKEVAEFASRGIRDKWFRLLQRLGEETGIDMFAKNSTFTWKDKPDAWQSHCMPIEKNLAAYFAKYASKDKDSGMPKTGSPVLFYPTTWWGRSRKLSQAVRENTIKVCLNYLTEEVAEEKVNMLHSVINNYNALKQYAYDYAVDLDCGSAGKMCVAFGVTRVLYFDDDEFSKVRSEVETLALILKEEARLLGAEWSGQLPASLAAVVRDGVFA